MVQVHQVIRLLSEAREIPAERPEREQHLVSGIVRIVGATVGISMFDTDCTPEAHGLRGASTPIGWDGEALRSPELPGQARTTFLSVIRATMRVTPTAPGVPVVAAWRELAADRRWFGVAHRDRHLGSAGHGDALFSSVRLRTPFHAHGLGLYREPALGPFADEDRNLVHVFHAECEGLLPGAPPDGDDREAGRARLSPRQRQTLALMLSGLCDKEIAERLGISRYTVNQYAKVIYRYYAVTSRAQLLARVLVQPQAMTP